MANLTVYVGQGYSTFVGLTLQTIGKIAFDGISTPGPPNAIPDPSGNFPATQIYTLGTNYGSAEVYTVTYNPSTREVEFHDTGQQVLVASLNDFPIPVSTYSPLALNPLPDGTLADSAARYSLSQVVGNGSTQALGLTLDGPCPGMSRTLIATIMDASGNFACANGPDGSGTVGAVTWTGPQYGYVGQIVLTQCAGGADLLQLVPVLNIILSLAALPTGTSSVTVPSLSGGGYQYLAAGVIAAGGSNSPDGVNATPNGGGGGGAFLAYLPVTAGNTYPISITTNSIQIFGDGGSSAIAYAGSNATPSSAGQGGQATVTGSAGGGAYTGGNGSLGTVSIAGAGGGGAGTGGNATSAVQNLDGTGGIASDGYASGLAGASPFPAGGNGGTPGAGAGADGSLDATVNAGGGASLTLYPGCAAFGLSTSQPYGVTGCISRPELLTVELLSCTCDPLELVFLVSNPQLCDCNSGGASQFYLVFTEP